MADLDDAKTNNRRERVPDVADQVEVYKFPDKKWTTLRLVPGLFSSAGYWISTKKRDGGKTKFFTQCPSYDPQSQERDSTIVDPWRDLQLKEAAAIKAKDLPKEKALIQFSQNFWMEAIVRSEQKKLGSRLPKPTRNELKTGFKEKDSDSLTPRKAIRLGKSLIGKLQELKGLNTVESKTGAVKAFAVNDAKYGCDIRIYYDKDKAPADQYQVQLGQRTPLTEDELAYLKQDLETATTFTFDEKTVIADYESWASRNGVKVASKKKARDEDEDEDNDFDDEAPKSKKTNKGKKSSEDFDDDEEDDFDDEDEDEAPKSKKKPAPKKRSSEEDDDDDFDDEEDDEPVKAKKPVKGKKPVDEDDFDEDEDDEEEAPKSKKKPASKAAKKPADDFDDDDEEDDDDFDDDDDEMEEDVEPPKSKKAVASKAKKPAAKSRKQVDEDEDDDFDEDDFDDEDEEEETPKPKKAAAKKPMKGKKPVDEDDFDDF